MALGEQRSQSLGGVETQEGPCNRTFSVESNVGWGKEALTAQGSQPNSPGAIFRLKILWGLYGVSDPQDVMGRESGESTGNSDPKLHTLAVGGLFR